MADNVYRGILVWGDAANPVPVTLGGSGTGGGAGVYTDRSNAALSGVSQALMAANASRRVLGIQNVAANPIAVNLGGGVAALNTAGSVTLAPGTLLLLDIAPPTGAVTIIGTAGDDVTAWES